MFEEEIDLIELLAILNKRKWIILVCFLVASMIGLGYTKYMVTPMYESETTIMVNSSKGSSIGDIAESFDLGSINLNQKLVVTYSVIVKSRIVLENVIDRMGLDMTYNQLKDHISASPVDSTEILRISVQDKSPEQASLIANTIASTFIKEVMRILKVDNVEIIDEAIPVNQAINVKYVLNTAIAGILGIMLGVFIIFVIAFLDQTIKKDEDIKRYLDLPVIGHVMEFDDVAKGGKG